MTAMGLVSLFGLGERELVAFVGAGGKSTLTLGLGRELSAARRRVVLTTTTKMGSDQVPSWVTVTMSASDTLQTLESGGAAFLVGLIDGEKVVGVPPAAVDRLYADSGATILVEADGARRRAFKAPGPDEPVIPSAASLVVVVAGLRALGGQIADVCHRPERVAALTGRSVGDPLRPGDMAAVLRHPEGGLKGVPPGARVAVVLTGAGPSHAAAVAEIRREAEGLPILTIGGVPRSAADLGG